MIKIEMDPDEFENIITQAVEKATKEMSDKISNIENALTTKTRVIKDGKSLIKTSIN
jgi:hypothetical protein